MDAKQSILSALEQLLEIAQRLRDAMMARDSAAIQAVVAEQDQLQELVYTIPHGAGQALAEDPDVQAVSSQLRRLQQGNRLLASAFLGIYRNTFRSGTPEQADPGLYTRTGSLFGTAPASMLVQQMG